MKITVGSINDLRFRGDLDDSCRHRSRYQFFIVGSDTIAQNLDEAYLVGLDDAISVIML